MPLWTERQRSRGPAHGLGTGARERQRKSLITQYFEGMPFPRMEVRGPIAAVFRGSLVGYRTGKIERRLSGSSFAWPGGNVRATEDVRSFSRSCRGWDGEHVCCPGCPPTTVRPDTPALWRDIPKPPTDSFRSRPTVPGPGRLCCATGVGARMRRGPWPAGVVGESPDNAECQGLGAGEYNDLSRSCIRRPRSEAAGRSGVINQPEIGWRGVVAVLVGCVALAGAMVSGQTRAASTGDTAPGTAWGDADLHGVWTGSSLTPIAAWTHRRAPATLAPTTSSGSTRGRR